MSGGSHNYECFRVEEEYTGRMHDAVMNKLIEDLVVVLHDLEWFDSGDICEGTYRQSVEKFKEKWFGTPVPALRDVIIEEMDRMKGRLLIALAWSREEGGSQ